MKERLSKEHLGAATHRERDLEEENADVGRPVRPCPDPCKLMATDLASGRTKMPLRDLLQWNLAPGRVLRSFFEPPDQMVEGALRLVDHMLTRQPEPPVRVDRRATPGAGRAEPEAVAQALELIRASNAGQPLPAEIAMLLADQLGADLTGVRVHTDDAADRAAVAIGAEASPSAIISTSRGAATSLALRPGCGSSRTKSSTRCSSARQFQAFEGQWRRIAKGWFRGHCSRQCQDHRSSHQGIGRGNREQSSNEDDYRGIHRRGEDRGSMDNSS